ncbi:MAG: protein kinase [Alphaproteobacteria bacterium]|nr:protein kinase [Alphaproteobacteria bacterium]
MSDSHRVLGERFELLGELGRGGAGTVYLAQDRLTERQVALKVLHSHHEDDAGARRQLAREVEAASRLRHEAVLVATDVHALDGQLCLSMPYHPGRSLSEAVALDGPLDEPALRELALRLSGALAEAHRAGVLHRDVTPSNVMLDADRRGAVLTDFGLARLEDKRATRSTGALGTAGYAAPEIWDGVRADPRSDLYGLGATLYLAATGVAPFAAPTPAGILKRQLAGEHTPLAELRPDLPEDLLRGIEALLKVDPDARPAGAQDVAEALAQRRAPELTPASPPAPLATTGHLQLPPGRWRVTVHNPRHRRRHRARGRDRVARESKALTQAVARAGGVPAAALDPEGLLGLERFHLVSGVDDATAAQLAGQARSLGIQARAERIRDNSGALATLLSFWPFLIPVIWVAFPFLIAGLRLDPLLVLPASVIATILLPAIGQRFGAEREPKPVVFRNAAPVGITENPTPALPERQPTRGEALLAQARAALQLLDERLRDPGGALPEPAALDLRETARGLRERAEELAEDVARLEAALSEESPQASEEQGWLSDRLRRLETLERAGQPVDAAERARLQRTLEQLAEAEAARERLEARLTASLAQLLEIRAAATSTRHALLGEGGPSASADALAQRLRGEAEALKRAQEELPELEDRRRRAATRQRQ